MFKLIDIIKKENILHLLDDNGIPSFSPRNIDERTADKYESLKQNIDLYTGLAYGATSTKKENELYQKISDLIIEESSKGENLILDVGCGVGRGIYDLAETMKKSQFVGFDYSHNMLERAKSILLDGGKLEIDLSSSGFATFKLNCKKHKNIQLAQGNVSELPFKPAVFDVVMNTFLIDRVPNVPEALKQLMEVLKPGGLFVLASPLNFQTQEDWQFKDPETLAKVLNQQGLIDIEIKDNIVHKEVIDARGNYKGWNTVMIWGRKRIEMNS